MIASARIRVDIQWVRTGNFFIWAHDLNARQRPIEAMALKHLLFAWHADSYFGTFVEQIEMGRQEGILLAAGAALDYFASPEHNEHVHIEWSDEIRQLLAIAPQLKADIANGALMPDFEKWKQGVWGWKLPALPDDRLPYVNEWLDAVLSERPERDHGLGGVMARWTQSYPVLHRDELPPALWTTEEDWLVSIGWKADTRPFRVCLKLSEPEDGVNWQLVPMLQDRERPEFVLECDAAGHPIDRNAPEDWAASLESVQQDIRKWTHLIPWISRDKPSGPEIRRSIHPNEAWDFLTDKSALLMQFGYGIFLPSWWERVKQRKPKLKAKLKSIPSASADRMFGVSQMLQFDWKLAIGDLELTEAEIRSIARQQQNLLLIRGQWIQLDTTILEQIRQSLKQVQKNQGLTFRDVLEFHLLRAQPGAVDSDGDPEAETDDSLPMEIEWNEQFEQWFNCLRNVSQIPSVEPPAALHGQLRKYQLEGSSWLLFLRRFGLGGCLADDMGLGKTIQWITYLLAVKQNEPPDAPSLLICPTSVIGNWQKELARFAPSLRVYVHYGANRHKETGFLNAVQGRDLVITSYTLAQMDEEDLRKLQWNSICLDEAQNIKNPYTKQSAAIRRLKAGHRIAMTGTPIENRLTELWSIFDFINPGYLGSLRAFTRHYVSRIEKAKDRKSAEELKRLIQPFLLRRVKNDPAIKLDLPDKLESKIFVPLTAEQAVLYEQVLHNLFRRLDSLSAMERRGAILSALTRLKQICDHPALFAGETGQAAGRRTSNKVERLLDMVRELRQQGDRCLIFTQFVGMGQMLQTALKRRLQEPALFLHGGVPKARRDDIIEQFQRSDANPEEGPECGVFILSLKAGGIGLNLTAANHVFHFDRWWNPAVEAQATDRAFRIGQTKHVHVHKFITLGTLEERIDDMIERKQGLSRQIVGEGEHWVTELSADELKDLFALRKEWVEE